MLRGEIDCDADKGILTIRSRDVCGLIGHCLHHQRIAQAGFTMGSVILVVIYRVLSPCSQLHCRVGLLIDDHRVIP